MLWIESVRSPANALNVGEYVRIERPGDADHDDREPVDEWDVAVEA
jgi:hypothetical protein